MRWYPIKNETPKAFQAFCVYLVMHKEKLLDVAKVLQLRAFTLEKLKKLHSWEARKEAFFNDVLLADTQDMHLRHIRKAIALQDKALRKFDSIEPENLSNSEMIRFLTAGANLERLARRGFESCQSVDFNKDNDLEKIDAFLDA